MRDPDFVANKHCLDSTSEESDLAQGVCHFPRQKLSPIYIRILLDCFGFSLGFVGFGTLIYVADNPNMPVRVQIRFILGRSGKVLTTYI